MENMVIKETKTIQTSRHDINIIRKLILMGFVLNPENIDLSKKHPRIDVDKKAIMNEHQLIKEKKSKLSNEQRRIVIACSEQLTNQTQ